MANLVCVTMTARCPWCGADINAACDLDVSVTFYTAHAPAGRSEASVVVDERPVTIAIGEHIGSCADAPPDARAMGREAATRARLGERSVTGGTSRASPGTTRRRRCCGGASGAWRGSAT